MAHQQEEPDAFSREVNPTRGSQINIKELKKKTYHIQNCECDLLVAEIIESVFLVFFWAERRWRRGRRWKLADENVDDCLCKALW